MGIAEDGLALGQGRDAGIQPLAGPVEGDAQAAAAFLMEMRRAKGSLSRTRVLTCSNWLLSASFGFRRTALCK